MLLNSLQCDHSIQMSAMERITDAQYAYLELYEPGGSNTNFVAKPQVITWEFIVVNFTYEQKAGCQAPFRLCSNMNDFEGNRYCLK